jgi:flagellar protein FlbT
MPLNLTLKPNEKLIVNGAVVSNNSPRAITLTFHNRAQLLQQKDVLLPEEANTPLLRTYFALQCLYLDPENADAHRKLFMEFATDLFSATGNADIRNAITSALVHVGAGEFYRALSALRAALPAERKLLDPSVELQRPED